MNLILALLALASIFALVFLFVPKKRIRKLAGLERPPLATTPQANTNNLEIHTQYICAVVGESFKNPGGKSRQAIIKKYVRAGMNANLVPEPNNPYDREAVAVYVAGHQIGYLKSEVAQRLNDKLAFDDFTASATVHEVHGGQGHKRNLGVTLEVTIYGKAEDARPLTPAQLRYEMSHTYRDDLPVMIDCCMQEELDFWGSPEGSRRIPRPIFFQRVAILQRKAKNYAAEVETCERWLKIAESYSNQAFVKAGGGYGFDTTKPHLDILKRLDKARLLLSNHGAKQ